jgi:uncharacterized protein involved in exopolysaccharide biosynthesis
MVRPTVTADLSERLNYMAQIILSRTRLELIIKEFDLYERERQELIMEDVIELMRRAITLNVPRRYDDKEPQSFSVAFESPEPRTAMRVTERLASLFVQENLEDRRLLAEQTEQFLQGQIDETKRRLEEQEQSMSKFYRSTGLRPPVDVVLDYEVLQEQYKTLARHANAASLAVSLEQGQIGQQFRVIDGALLPERPIRPRLVPYLALGTLAGLGVGIVLSLTAALWRRQRARKAALAPAAA